MKIRFFETRRGHAPVQEYIESLPAREAASIRAALMDICERGLAKTLVDLRQIRNKLWEIKLQPHRIFMRSSTMTRSCCCMPTGSRASALRRSRLRPPSGA